MGATEDGVRGLSVVWVSIAAFLLTHSPAFRSMDETFCCVTNKYFATVKLID